MLVLQQLISRTLIVTWLTLGIAVSVFAQDQSETTTGETSIPAAEKARHLDELARLLKSKIEQREELQQTLAGADDSAMTQEREELSDIERDMARLRRTFEIVAIGGTDISIIVTDEETETDWRQDLIDILDPLIDSLKSVTERPRQLAELRDSIYLNQKQLEVTEQALSELRVIPEGTLDTSAQSRVTELISKWAEEQEQLGQELQVSQSQLDRLSAEHESFFEGFWPSTRAFLLGRGLTVIIAVLFAVLAWLVMRFLWWLYTTFGTTKEQRRNTTWFRLLAYSYYLLTTIVIILVVLLSLYIREDLLLLALALLLIFGAVLRFKEFLPRYIKEARILLNLGSIREDERVVYNGLPWQVMSLNLLTVLRNPALDGVLRLPMETVSTLVSRPVKNALWFPTNKGDFVILPDGLLGQVTTQTPDLVELAVRGGMSMTYQTCDFYAINLINLSREKTFGVSVTLGLDYSLQSISLTQIPSALKQEVESYITDAGYDKHLRSLIAEFSAAGASSLDFLVFATFDSNIAGQYYKAERLLQQACLSASNKHGWPIPFPQLTVHRAPNENNVEKTYDS